jgi:hypothetical protein
VLNCLAANLLLVCGTVSAKNCGLKPLGSADISVPRDRFVLVEVKVNDHPAVMRLDMSSAISLVDSRYLELLGLRALTAQKAMELVTATKTIKLDHYTKFTSLEIGSGQFGSPGLFVLPSDETAPSPVDRPDVGSLGMDVLGGVDLDLDFANNKLNFFSRDHCGSEPAYWTRDCLRTALVLAPLGNYLFPVELEGKRVEAVISMAIGQSWMTTDAARQLYGFDENSAGAEAGSSDSTHVAYRDMTLSGIGPGSRRVKIAIEPIPVDPACMLTSHGTGAAWYQGRVCRGAEAPLHLGLDVLRHVHLYFATKEQAFYLSDAAATK